MTPVILVESVEHHIDPKLIRLIGNLCRCAGMIIAPSVIDVSRVVEDNKPPFIAHALGAVAGMMPERRRTIGENVRTLENRVIVGNIDKRLAREYAAKHIPNGSVKMAATIINEKHPAFLKAVVAKCLNFTFLQRNTAHACHKDKRWSAFFREEFQPLDLTELGILGNLHTGPFIKLQKKVVVGTLAHILIPVAAVVFKPYEADSRAIHSIRPAAGTLALAAFLCGILRSVRILCLFLKLLESYDIINIHTLKNVRAPRINRKLFRLFLLNLLYLDLLKNLLTAALGKPVRLFSAPHKHKIRPKENEEKRSDCVVDGAFPPAVAHRGFHGLNDLLAGIACYRLRIKLELPAQRTLQ